MIPQKRKFFVIIVHYGLPALTKKAIMSLYKNKTSPDTIIVVDHSGNLQQGMDGRMRSVIVLSQENKGYGAGINAGLRHIYKNIGVSSADIVVCMNNDVELDPGSIDKLQKWWQKQHGFVLAGLKGGSVSLLSGRARITPRIKKDGALAISYVHGSFFTAPIGLMQAIGGMPEEYFMYWEDVAVSRKAVSLGGELDIADGVFANHNDEERGVSDRKLYYLVRNGASFLQSQAGVFWSRWWRIVNKGRYWYHKALRKDKRGKIAVRALRDAMLWKQSRL